MNYEQERRNDVDKILSSSHPRRVVVAGPGTGKSFLFEQAIKKELANGKKRFLAITFIGKLGDALADDLAGLAETTTLHGFARKFVLDNCPAGWEYYPEIAEIIREDLSARDIKSTVIGDSRYRERTNYYRAVGQEDVIHYAVEICETNKEKIPRYDLILIDEFQDFNEIESRLVDQLATRNKVLIVGDDDQALYEFKGSSPRFIREKFHISNTAYESHTLRFCSRCTPVIIETFHDVVNVIGKSGQGGDRISKEYICYLPDKKKDGELNPKIILLEKFMPGQIPIRVKVELQSMLRQQKIKSVLVIGEGRSCQAVLLDVAEKLRSYGFKSVDHRDLRAGKFDFKRRTISAYQILAKQKNKILAWRLLSTELSAADQKRLILKSYADAELMVADLPKKFVQDHSRNAEALEKVFTKPPSEIRQIGGSTIEGLIRQVVHAAKDDREIFVDQIIAENKMLPRPLGSLDITACSILGAKGLSADVVFLVGFDQGRLPSDKKPSDSEVYQFLVALTRARKRIYLVNTGGKPVSSFIDLIKPERVETKCGAPG